MSVNLLPIKARVKEVGTTQVWYKKDEQGNYLRDLEGNGIIGGHYVYVTFETPTLQPEVIGRFAVFGLTAEQFTAQVGDVGDLYLALRQRTSQKGATYTDVDLLDFVS